MKVRPQKKPTQLQLFDPKDTVYYGTIVRKRMSQWIKENCKPLSHQYPMISIREHVREWKKLVL